MPVPARATAPARAAADEALATDRRSVEGHTDLGLWTLREGRTDDAEEPFQQALDADPQAWPALLGLGATLDARHLPLRDFVRDAAGPADLPLLARLVEPWEALTPDERRLIVLSIAPFAQYLPRLVEAGGRLHVVALEGRCTDLPAFADARGVQVEDEDDRRTHDAIEGMAIGPVAAARLDTFYALERDGCTVAHELGHAVHAVLDEPWQARIVALFEKAVATEWLSTTYGLTNEHELLATGYERYVLRAAHPDGPRAELDHADRKLGLDALFDELRASRA